MPARSWPGRSCVTSEMTLQPIAGQLQLRRGREIPICVNRVDVAEIGRQDRQSRTWIIAVAIGVEDGVDRKAVSKIVQPRPACRRTRHDAGMTNKSLERVLHARRRKPQERSAKNQQQAEGRNPWFLAASGVGDSAYRRRGYCDDEAGAAERQAPNRLPADRIGREDGREERGEDVGQNEEIEWSLRPVEAGPRKSCTRCVASCGLEEAHCRFMGTPTIEAKSMGSLRDRTRPTSFGQHGPQRVRRKNADV